MLHVYFCSIIIYPRNKTPFSSKQSILFIKSAFLTIILKKQKKGNPYEQKL